MLSTVESDINLPIKEWSLDVYAYVGLKESYTESYIFEVAPFWHIPMSLLRMEAAWMALSLLHPAERSAETSYIEGFVCGPSGRTTEQCI